MRYLWCAALILSFLVSPAARLQQLSEGSGGGWDSDRFYVFGWPVKRELDIGHFLTFLTLFAGFTGWLLTSVRDRRKKSHEDSRSGALRLLLKILRENNGPIKIEELKNRFDSPALKDLRKAYCGTDFKFKDTNTFEGAIYRLDWEGKIDFPTPDEIAFRLDKTFAATAGPSLPATPNESKILDIFKNALGDKKVGLWDLEPLAQASLVVDPRGTSDLLNDALTSSDPETQRRAAALFGKFPPASLGKP